MAGRSTFGRFDTSKNHCLMPTASTVRNFRNLSFNHIEYVRKPLLKTSTLTSSKTYKDIASGPLERKRMEAILQAMTHFYQPATPRDIARTISRSAWGYDVVHEDTVDSYLKRLPEVEYVQWGKYLLKSKNI